MAEIPSRILPTSRKEALAAGSPRFFKGTPCKKGHISERYALGSCVECTKENADRWRVNRADYRRLMDIKWRQNNKQKLAEKYQEKKEAISAISKKRWAERDVAVEKEKSRRFREENLEHLQAYQKKWREQNKEKKMAANRNYKAARHANGGSHMASDIIDIVKAQKGKCAYCRVKFGETYHVDHIVPLFRGGSNGRHNLQILCPRCNLQKGKSDPIDHAQSLGFLL